MKSHCLLLNVVTSIISAPWCYATSSCNLVWFCLTESITRTSRKPHRTMCQLPKRFTVEMNAYDFEFVRGRRSQMKWQATGIMSFSGISIRKMSGCYNEERVSSFPFTRLPQHLLSFFYKIAFLPPHRKTFPQCNSSEGMLMMISFGYVGRGHFIIKLSIYFVVFGLAFFGVVSSQQSAPILRNAAPDIAIHEILTPNTNARDSILIENHGHIENDTNKNTGNYLQWASSLNSEQ